MMTRDSMIIFGIVGALFLILLIMFLMTAEMFREGYRGNRRKQKKKMPVKKKKAVQKMKKKKPVQKMKKKMPVQKMKKKMPMKKKAVQKMKKKMPVRRRN
jgi:biopolymer transport protein ExbD